MCMPKIINIKKELEETVAPLFKALFFPRTQSNERDGEITCRTMLGGVASQGWLPPSNSNFLPLPPLCYMQGRKRQRGVHAEQME